MQNYRQKEWRNLKDISTYTPAKLYAKLWKINIFYKNNISDGKETQDKTRQSMENDVYNRSHAAIKSFKNIIQTKWKKLK